MRTILRSSWFAPVLALVIVVSVSVVLLLAGSGSGDAERTPQPALPATTLAPLPPPQAPQLINPVTGESCSATFT